MCFDESSLSNDLVSPNYSDNQIRVDMPDTILGIVANTLSINLSDLTLNDNFVLLGGESLVAGELASRIRGRFGVDISIRSIFLNTIGELGEEISHKLRSAEERGAQ